MSIDWLVIFTVATNGKILIHVIHQGSILSPDARIEVIDIDDSVDVEVTDTPNNPNFKEQQSIAITRCNNLLLADQQSYKNYMKNNKMMC